MGKILSVLTVIILIIIAGIAGITYLSPDLPQTFQSGNNGATLQGEITINTPRSTILAEVVSTPQDIERGLGGRSSLPMNRGMLFVFDSPSRPGFWMKNMFFPIDIIWIDATGTVVGVENDVSHRSYPELFYPPSPVKYVLEINAGQAAYNNIVEGTILSF